MRFNFYVSLAVLLGVAATSSAQMSMGGMSMPATPPKPPTLIDTIVRHESSGTSVEPGVLQPPMLMQMHGGWMLMLHGIGFAAEQQQSGPRGADKLFSVNWLMPMASRTVGPGTLTLRAMLSLEPATITGRYYPELFQQGETAYGKPIVDGQHPHNFFMELAALYDVKLGAHTLLSFYGAPMGDPAIGPTAFPHRSSASEDPLAALGHHQEDSTHISADVVTTGLTYRMARVELSGFHGQEPNENRWQIISGKLDSYSARLTLAPTPHWSGQYSIGRLASPEALYPGENQLRQTASVMEGEKLRVGELASTAVWGRTKSLSDGSKENSYLAESTLRLRKQAVWLRVENAGRSNELLLSPGTPLPLNFVELPIGHVQAYSFGYDHQLPVRDAGRMAFALGVQPTFYKTPNALVATYGPHPVGVLMFLRIGLKPQK